MKKRYIAIYLSLFLFSVGMHSFFIYHNAYFVETCCDSLRQIAYFYPFIKHQMLFDNPFWSWSYGLGGDVFAQFSYYLTTSPFFWLFSLFNIDTLKDTAELRLYMSIFKQFIMIIFMFHLLVYCKRSITSSIVGAITYGGSTYFTFYSFRYDFMIDGMVWLPLIIWGYERLKNENKKWLFVTALFIILTSNFYLAYINCIYVGLYSLYHYFRQVSKKSLKHFVLYQIHYIKYFFLSLLLASFAFLPAVYAFLHTDRFYYELDLPLFFSIEFYKSYIYHLLFYNNFQSLNTVMPIIVLIVGLYGIMLKQQTVKATNLFFYFMIVLSFFPIVYSFFNGLSIIQYRWLYLLVFTGSLSVSYSLDEWLKENYKVKKLYVGFMTIFLIVLLKFKSEITGKYVDKDELLILLLAIIILICIFLRNQLNRKLITSVIIIAVTINAVIINFKMYSDFINQADQFRSRQDMVFSQSNYGINEDKEIFKYIQQKDNGFYRIIWNNLKEFNAPLIYRYNGFSAYNSLLDGTIHDFMKNKYSVLHQNSPSLFINLDNRLTLETVLANKYYILSERDSYEPYGYRFLENINGYKIYENKYYLQPGFLYTKIVDEKDFANLNSAQRDELLLHAAVVNRKQYNSLPAYDTDKLNVITKDIDKESVIVTNGTFKKNILTVGSNATLTIPNAIQSKNGETLLEIELIRLDGLPYRIEVNNKSFHFFGDKDPYNYPKKTLVFNVGMSNHRDIAIKLTDGKYMVNNIQVHFRTYENYTRNIKKLKSQSLINVMVDKNRFKGQINTETEGLLFLAIPYSDGWNAKVNGEKVEILRVNSSFIGIPVSEGNNLIDLYYITPMFRTGVTISIATFIITLITSMISYRRKKRGNSK